MITTRSLRMRPARCPKSVTFDLAISRPIDWQDVQLSDDNWNLADLLGTRNRKQRHLSSLFQDDFLFLIKVLPQ
jgi:hypothetical protein